MLLVPFFVSVIWFFICFFDFISGNAQAYVQKHRKKMLLNKMEKVTGLSNEHEFVVVFFFKGEIMMIIANVVFHSRIRSSHVSYVEVVKNSLKKMRQIKNK